MASDNTIVIGVETTGAAKAKHDLDSISTSIQKTGESSSVSLNKLGAGFKSVSRDIDALTGNASAGFAKWASDITGVVEAFSGGGLMAAITGVSAVVGVAVGLYQQWQAEAKEAAKKAEDAAKAATDAAKAHANLVKEIATGIREGQKQINMEMVLQKEAELQARRLVLMRKGEELIQAELAKVQAKGVDEFKAASNAKDKLVADMAREQAAILLEEKKVSDEKHKLLTQETNKWEVDEWKEKEDKKKNITNDANADYARSMKVITAAVEKQKHDESAKFKAGYDKNLAEFKSFESEVSHINSEGIKLRAEKHGEWVEEYIRLLNVAANEEDKINKAALKARAEAFRDGKLDEEKKALEKVTKADKDAAAAKKKHTEEIKAQNKAIYEHTSAVYGSAAAMVFSDSVTWAIQPGIEMLTGKLDQLGQVNRDNFWELYDFSKMTPELVAAQVQAMLAGVAKEALTKTAFESAEALKETAMGIGSIAINDPKGAAMHFASASAHVAAAGAYGMIGGAAATGAVAIGATRGATAEEKEKERMKRDGGRGTIGNGPSGGSGVTRDGSGDGWTVNVINNAPLIVPQQDSRVAGRAVARAVSSANRSSFTERMMRAG